MYGLWICGVDCYIDALAYMMNSDSWICFMVTHMDIGFTRKLTFWKVSLVIILLIWWLVMPCLSQILVCFLIALSNLLYLHVCVLCSKFFTICFLKSFLTIGVLWSFCSNLWSVSDWCEPSSILDYNWLHYFIQPLRILFLFCILVWCSECWYMRP